MPTTHGFILEYPLIRVDKFTAGEVPIPPSALNADARQPEWRRSFEEGQTHFHRPQLYLLSHIHTDHLQGLASRGHNAPIYCSQVTKETLLLYETQHSRIKGLGQQQYAHLRTTQEGTQVINTARSGLNAPIAQIDVLHVLPLNQPVTVDYLGPRKVQLTLIEANHMFGATMFLVQGDCGAVLHTGDMRAEVWWCDALVRNPHLQPYVDWGRPDLSTATYSMIANQTLEDENWAHCMDAEHVSNRAGCSSSSSTQHEKPRDTSFRLRNVYLDTSMVKSFSDTLSKAEAVADLVAMLRCFPSSTAVFLDMWTPGYEDMARAVAKAFGTPIHVDKYKFNQIESAKSEDPFLAKIITRDSSTRFHACEVKQKCDTFARWEAETRSKQSSHARGTLLVHPTEISAVGWQLLREKQMRHLFEAKTGGRPWPTFLLIPLARHSPVPELQYFLNIFRPCNIVANDLGTGLLDAFSLPHLFEQVLFDGGRKTLFELTSDAMGVENWTMLTSTFETFLEGALKAKSFDPDLPGSALLHRQCVFAALTEMQRGENRQEPIRQQAGKVLPNTGGEESITEAIEEMRERESHEHRMALSANFQESVLFEKQHAQLTPTQDASQAFATQIEDGGYEADADCSIEVGGRENDMSLDWTARPAPHLVDRPEEPSQTQEIHHSAATEVDDSTSVPAARAPDGEELNENLELFPPLDSDTWRYFKRCLDICRQRGAHIAVSNVDPEMHVMWALVRHQRPGLAQLVEEQLAQKGYPMSPAARAALSGVSLKSLSNEAILPASLAEKDLLVAGEGSPAADTSVTALVKAHKTGDDETDILASLSPLRSTLCRIRHALVSSYSAGHLTTDLERGYMELRSHIVCGRIPYLSDPDASVASDDPTWCNVSVGTSRVSFAGFLCSIMAYELDRLTSIFEMEKSSPTSSRLCGLNQVVHVADAATRIIALLLTADALVLTCSPAILAKKGILAAFSRTLLAGEIWREHASGRPVPAVSTSLEFVRRRLVWTAKHHSALLDSTEEADFLYLSAEPEDDGKMPSSPSPRKRLRVRHNNHAGDEYDVTSTGGFGTLVPGRLVTLSDSHRRQQKKVEQPATLPSQPSQLTDSPAETTSSQQLHSSADLESLVQRFQSGELTQLSSTGSRITSSAAIAGGTGGQKG